MKPRINRIVVKCRAILPLIIQTDSRALSDKTEIACTGGAHTICGHRIPKQQVLPKVQLIPGGQTKKTGNRGAAGFRSRQECRGKFGFSGKKSRGPRTADDLNSCAKASKRILQIEPEDFRVVAGRDARWHPLSSNLRGSADRQAPLGNEAADPEYSIEPAVEIAEEPVAVKQGRRNRGVSDVTGGGDQDDHRYKGCCEESHGSFNLMTERRVNLVCFLESAIAFIPIDVLHERVNVHCRI